MDAKGITLALVALVGVAPAVDAQQLGCADLNGAYIVSREPTPRYLGFFGSRFAGESVMNEFGTYGSRFNSLSVRNTFGTYGSAFSIYSANNAFTLSPPLIVRSGQFLAFLSVVNSPFSLPLATIDSVCGASFFTATAPLAPIVSPPASTIPALGSPPPASFVLTDAYGGTFSNASRDGEGLQITFGQIDGQRFLIAAAYTYDTSGNQMWLIGAAAVNSASRGPHSIPVVRARGPRFGAGFDPTQVVREPWGTLSVTFDSCDQISLALSPIVPGFDSGTVGLARTLPRTPDARCP